MIKARIKRTTDDFQGEWKNSQLAGVFDAEVADLTLELQALRQSQQSHCNISILELITALQLAVWKHGNPKGTFSQCWRDAFSNSPTPERAVSIFWDGLITGYRTGRLINWVLNGSGDFSFILREYERKTYAKNIHFGPPPGFSPLPLDLEHIFPIDPAPGTKFGKFGFIDEKSYRDFLDKVENRTYIHKSLNRGAQNNPPFLKVHDYITQAKPIGQKVNPFVETTKEIGNGLNSIQIVGPQSQLYRAWLQLWGVKIALFVAKFF